MQKRLGISIYLGLDIPLEKNLEYMRRAAKFGYSHLFTSLHIPEANRGQLLRDFAHMMQLANELSFRVTADISPKAMDLLGCSFEDLSTFRRIGLSAVRLDYGFSAYEIAKATRESDLTIEINASTGDAHFLDELHEAGANFNHLQACHNFYPRPETGLSYSLFAERSQVYKKLGIRVLAFIPSMTHPRAPLYEGLPTLESHRSMSPMLAAKHLWASDLVDTILFGDPLASMEDLQVVSMVDPEVIALSVRPVTALALLSIEERQLLSMVHTNRFDPGQSVIRSQEARTVVTQVPKRKGGGTRTKGTVTVDNDLYGRYCGELQITLEDLPENPKINTLARVVPEELFLLEYIKPGKKFRFEVKE